jgi:hypothetical protein
MPDRAGRRFKLALQLEFLAALTWLLRYCSGYRENEPYGANRTTERVEKMNKTG